MHPINGMHLWPQLDMLNITLPSWVMSRKEKRQINWRKGADEDVIVHSRENNYIQRNGRLKMICSVRGERGHNKRYHSRPDALDSVGKMVPKRGQRASSDHSHGNEQTFHFIPTSTLSCEPCSGGLKSGAATMVFA
ncbi:Hypothetical predicted protein [Olea europaea subsp. europaea]|uniref:Uncharacterized protein n=1 Tax=Olea europaea subsp. europaea TaxID=158383 RepID=A0A8S0RT79_OLEEU|nr:Hypothetical predicted protein [Olea europaea subsp. europaea]